MHLPKKRIGRTGKSGHIFRKWLPRSPALTATFLYGSTKTAEQNYLDPTTLNNLQKRMTEAVSSITPDALQSIWSELDYHIEVCRITGEVNIGLNHMKLYQLM